MQKEREERPTGAESKLTFSALTHEKAIAFALENMILENGVGQRRSPFGRDSVKIASKRNRRSQQGDSRSLERHLHILPKAAFHLEEAGKKSRALDFYFRAGLYLKESGSSATADMFKKCDALASELGDNVSIYMRANYLYHLADYRLGDGYVSQL